MLTFCVKCPFVPVDVLLEREQHYDDYDRTVIDTYDKYDLKPYRSGFTYNLRCSYGVRGIYDEKEEVLWSPQSIIIVSPVDRNLLRIPTKDNTTLICTMDYRYREAFNKYFGH